MLILVAISSLRRELERVFSISYLYCLNRAKSALFALGICAAGVIVAIGYLHSN